MTTPSTIRVVIPLKVKRRNGRPRIVLPSDNDAVDPPTQAAHVLRAIARAWSWRRMLERGQVSTVQDIASMEKVSDRYVSRMMRLAYLSPDVLEELIISRALPAVSLNALVTVAQRPWPEQREAAFEHS